MNTTVQNRNTGTQMEFTNIQVQIHTARRNKRTNKQKKLARHWKSFTEESKQKFTNAESTKIINEKKEMRK